MGSVTMEIKRDAYLQQLIERKDNGMIKVITGIRRCGKSFPIFTSRFQLTILGTSELNYCVRNGNRWDLTVIVTDHMTESV